jgi:hypothetical protein
VKDDDDDDDDDGGGGGGLQYSELDGMTLGKYQCLDIV